MLFLSLLPAVSILVIFLTLLYKYLTRNHDFWKKRGVPGPRPWPLFGNSLDNFFASASETQTKRVQKYGKVYGYFEGYEPHLMVADRELIKLISIKDSHLFINRGPPVSSSWPFGETMVDMKDDKWRAFRAAMSPTFTSGKLRRMFCILNQCSDLVLPKLEKAAKTKADVDMKALFGAFTVDVIARTAFGIQSNAQDEAKHDTFVEMFFEIFRLPKTRFLLMTILPNFLLKLLDIDTIPRTAREFFPQLSLHLLSERRKTRKPEGTDFMQLMLDAEIKLSPEINNNEIQAKEGEKEERRPLTDREIVPQMILFMVAGYETTATLLSFVAYALALHTDKQDILCQEIRNAFKSKLDEMNYDSVNQLEYLNAIVSETLRLYTIAPMFHRVAAEDYPLGSTGIVIPKGVIVQTGFHYVQHDPENFPDPEVFRPERFLKDNLDEIPPYAYIPFGLGPRNCIGMRFALIEAKVLLCRMLLEYKFIVTKKTSIPLEFQYHPGINIVKNVILGVVKE